MLTGYLSPLPISFAFVSSEPAVVFILHMLGLIGASIALFDDVDGSNLRHILEWNSSLYIANESATRDCGFKRSKRAAWEGCKCRRHNEREARWRRKRQGGYMKMVCYAQAVRLGLMTSARRACSCERQRKGSVSKECLRRTPGAGLHARERERKRSSPSSRTDRSAVMADKQGSVSFVFPSLVSLSLSRWQARERAINGGFEQRRESRR